MRKPKRLKPGSQVAVLSPSCGAAVQYRNVLDLGLRNLEIVFGLQIVEFPSVRLTDDELYRNPKIRAKDVNAAFKNPEIDAVIATIGGDDSVRILPFLDLNVIRANPKLLMGYSDTTTLTTYLNQQGLVTFNGPSVMAGFAQTRHLPKAFREHVRTMLFEAPAFYDYKPYETWTNRYAPWTRPRYDGEVAVPKPNTERWRWIQGKGTARGQLYGGCIEVLEFMKGTEFWPPVDFWKGKILFLETSEDKPGINNVMYMLRNYGTMGVLERLSGIIFGRARDYTDQEKRELEKMIVRVMEHEFSCGHVPVIANFDFGHTEPQLIFPLGVECEIDCEQQTVRLLESALS